MRTCRDCQRPIPEGESTCPRCRTVDDVAAVATVREVFTDDNLPALTDPLVGKVVAGRFEVLKLIGQGGMGKVYKARHKGLDRVVCLKTLRPALLDDPTVVGRFEREARSASRLVHPNAIQVLDFGEDDTGGLYLAMEFVEGRDLRQVLLADHPLGEERIARILAQVLDALAEAHSRKVIHRDLKPENIMVGPRGDELDFVKVLDFGIAKIQDANVPGLTRADVVCGTPLYMSPEQATGSPFDARADIYAVGVILYQLTTGQLPFDGANSLEILTRHVNDRPVPPRERAPQLDISEGMELLILRALDKDANRRPQTAQAFREELLRLAEQARRSRISSASPSGYISPPPAVATGSDRIAPGRKWLVAGVAVGALVGAAALLLSGEDPPASPPVSTAVPTHGSAPPPVAPAPVAAVPTQPVAQPATVVAPPPRREPSPVPSKTAADWIDEADLAYEEGNYPRAVKLFRSAIRADRRSVKAHRGLFRAGNAAGDKDAMRDGGRRYLELSPEASDANTVRNQLEAMGR